MRDFRVDRIRTCRPTGERAAPRPGFDLDEYAALCSLPSPHQRAVLRLPLARREKAHRHFGSLILSESILKPAAQVRLTVAFWDLSELARWLLGLGAELTVESPKALRVELVALARAAAEHHGRTHS